MVSYRLESHHSHWAGSSLLDLFLPCTLCKLMRPCSLSWVLAHGLLPFWQDLAVLQDKLRISTKKLEEYETLFKCQEETTQKLVLEYQARLEEGEERLRRQQEDKDIQMKGIISR